MQAPPGCRIKTVWRSGERLLVAVGPSPSSIQLVRWTLRMAAAQGASWIAVSVESSRPPDAAGRRRLEQNLALARELGAEVVITHDDDVADALVRVALQNNATQIVVGKSRSPRWLDALRGGGSLVDRLLRISGPIDIYVVPSERAAEKAAAWLDWRAGRAIARARSTVRWPACSPGSRSPAGLHRSHTRVISRSACSTCWRSSP